MPINITKQLAAIKLEDFCKELMQNPLIELDAATPVEDGFKTLVDNGILSAPLKSESNTYVGMVDMDDLVSLLVTIFNPATPRPEGLLGLRDVIQKRRVFSEIPLSAMSDLSLRNPFVPVPISGTLADAVAKLREGVHRVPVMCRGKVVAILSQSAIINYLAKHASDFPDLANTTLRDVGLGDRRIVHQVNASTPALEALQLMHTAGVSGVPVTDETGAVLTNFSTSDVKLLSKSNNFGDLYLTTREFVCKVRNIDGAKGRWPTMEAAPTTTLADIIARLAATRVHRLYITDGSAHCVSVVSLKDVLAKLT